MRFARRRAPSSIALQRASRSRDSITRQTVSEALRSMASLRRAESRCRKAPHFSSVSAALHRAEKRSVSLSAARMKESSSGVKPKAAERSSAMSGISLCGLSITVSIDITSEISIEVKNPVPCALPTGIPSASRASR